MLKIVLVILTGCVLISDAAILAGPALEKELYIYKAQVRLVYDLLEKECPSYLKTKRATLVGSSHNSLVDEANSQHLQIQMMLYDQLFAKLMECRKNGSGNLRSTLPITSMKTTTAIHLNTTTPIMNSTASTASVQQTTQQFTSTSMNPTATMKIGPATSPAVTTNVPSTTTDQPTRTMHTTAIMQPTTTMQETSTMQPSTTMQSSTNMQPTSTMQPSTTMQSSTTMQPTKTMQPISTVQPTTTMQPSTTNKLSTTMDSTTSIKTTTSWVSKTTILPSTTMKIASPTMKPTTTAQPTTAVRILPTDCRTALNYTQFWRLDHNGSDFRPKGSHSLDGYACDLHVSKSNAWFRFSGAGGNRMLDSCPSKDRSCGTKYPFWTDEKMPKDVGVETTVQAYARYGSDCKDLVRNIQVMRCSWLTNHDLIYKAVDANYKIPCQEGFCGML